MPLFAVNKSCAVGGVSIKRGASERLTFFVFFFFNDTATTEIYTLSLHDALPILGRHAFRSSWRGDPFCAGCLLRRDRKSTRLNSSHSQISYAVFCLKKKKKLSEFPIHILYGCQSYHGLIHALAPLADVASVTVAV